MTQSRRRISAVGILIAVNCGVFLYQLLRPDFNETLLELYGLSSQGVEQGAWWQLITHAFLHGNIWHLLFNMAGLWFAGTDRRTGNGNRPVSCSLLRLRGRRRNRPTPSGRREVPLARCVRRSLRCHPSLCHNIPRGANCDASLFRHSLAPAREISRLGSDRIVLVVFACRIRAVDWTCCAPRRLCRGISSRPAEWLWPPEFSGAAHQENLALLEGDLTSERRLHARQCGATEWNRNARCR